MLRIMLVTVAVMLFLVGCGSNPVSPTQKNTSPIISNERTKPNSVPYYEHMYDGEPHRGTDPDLGPTG